MCRFRKPGLFVGQPIGNEFQYIKCAGSAAGNEGEKECKTGISIHQMCRFRAYVSKHSHRLDSIFQYIKCAGSAFCFQRARCFPISIHQMCRFRAEDAIVFATRELFQYIKCAGSAVVFFRKLIPAYFISIHQMCRFRD